MENTRQLINVFNTLTPNNQDWLVSVAEAVSFGQQSRQKEIEQKRIAYETEKSWREFCEEVNGGQIIEKIID